jgi:hypothetical protein
MTNPKKNTPPAVPAFTHDELLVINNALNEVCNGISFDDDEFQTRIGQSRDKALAVLKKVAKSLEYADRG